MDRLYILLIISTLIISCNTFNASKNKEELLLGDWYGGAGTKYSVNKGTKRWIQDLAAGKALLFMEKIKSSLTIRPTPNHVMN